MSTPTPAQAAAALNANKPPKGATPTTLPAVTDAPALTAPTVPSTTTGSFGLSNTEMALPLAGADNSDVLGSAAPGQGHRTAYDAVSALHKMSKPQIDGIQQQLISAGILKGKYRAGVADPATTSAFRTAILGSIGNQQPISEYLGTLAATSIASATAAAIAKPTFADPALIETSLANAATVYGKKITPNLLNKFAAQIRAAENAKPNSRVQIDVPAEAQLFAAQAFGSTGTTKVAASTDADITKAAAAMGVTLSDTARRNIAAQVDANSKATGSPDVNLLNQLVAAQFKMPSDPTQLTGDAAQVYNDLKNLSGQYLLPLGASSLGSWVSKAIKGQSYAGSLTGDAEAEFRTWAAQQAAVQRPWLAAATNNFATTDPYTATAAYRTAISDTMQLGNPDTVDLNDPKYAKLLQPGANGAPPDLASIRQTIQTDPIYNYSATPLAKQQAYTVGVGLLQKMGVKV